MSAGIIVGAAQPGSGPQTQARAASPALLAAGLVLRTGLGLAVGYGARRQAMSDARRLFKVDE